MPQQVHRQRNAMATLFELWLVGEDPEHLGAVAEAALEEFQRIESLLSRFDPASEIARLNREAIHRPVLVDYEVLAILKDCKHRFKQTNGYFNICALTSEEGLSRKSSFPLIIDEQNRTVKLSRTNALIDPGGYGKGYALDAAAHIMSHQGVNAGFLHGGTSSAMALAGPAENEPWVVTIDNPFVDDHQETMQVKLVHQGLSTSAALNPGQHHSDVVNPVQGQCLTQQAACTVLAPTALDAEVLSTALLAMGKEKAIDYLQEQSDQLPQPCSVLWQEQSNKPLQQWLQGGPDERNN